MIPRWPHSLRWRVVALAVVVVAIAFGVVGVAVDLVLGVQLRRDAQGRLDDRAARAVVLVAPGTPRDQLPVLLDGQGIAARVVDAGGRTVAGEAAGRGPDGRGGPGGVPGGVPAAGPDGPGRRGGPPGTGAEVARTEIPLAGGDRLVLRTDPGDGEVVLYRLRGVLIAVGAFGLVVTALALLAGVRVALRPLDAMTALARDISAGDRGRRLRPARTDTELGRTAAAFDAMLDALEAAREDAERAADEARRSEATTRRFLSDAAHELRTPITGVQALAESLVRHPDADLERRERVATTVVRETRRAGALVADMLELARIEDSPGLVRRPVDLAALAAAEVERTALLAPSLTVDTGSTDVPVTVDADPARVTQILANLLDNARRHSPAAGRITVTTAREGDTAAVEVADEGTGIPEADRERVFDRLVRLDDARSRDGAGLTGAGLGLAIARALARAHGGDLRAVDPAGAGARLRLTLPAT